MASDRIRNFARDDGGAVFLEFTVAGMFFLVLVFGIIEFSNAFYQWNLATKATQQGARLAAVSNPVASNLLTMTGLGGGVGAGDPMPAFDYECWATSASTGTCTNGGTFNLDALRIIYRGRNGSGNASCTDGGPQTTGMCDVFPRLLITNIAVRYTNTGGATGQGYAGRPGGPVATISVRIKDMSFDYVLLNSILGVNSFTMPGFTTTMTSEDLKLAAPS